AERIELPTFGLQNRCTTAVLRRPTNIDTRCRGTAADIVETAGGVAARRANGKAPVVSGARDRIEVAADDMERHCRGIGNVEAGKRARHVEPGDAIAHLPRESTKALPFRAEHQRDLTAIER